MLNLTPKHNNYVNVLSNRKKSCTSSGKIRMSFRSNIKSKTDLREGQSLSDQEHTIRLEIFDIEKQLKDLPFLDLNIKITDIDSVIDRSVQDFMANFKESIELKSLLDQVNKEISDMEKQEIFVKKQANSSRKRENRTHYQEKLSLISSKKISKMGVYRRLLDLRDKNENQKQMIQRFMANLCKQGKQKELDEKLKGKYLQLQLVQSKQKNQELERELRRARQLTSKKCLLESEYLADSNFQAKENDPRNANLQIGQNSDVSGLTNIKSEKSFQLSRKDSFMTNVSKRYQEASEDEDSETSRSSEGPRRRTYKDRSYTQKSCHDNRESPRVTNTRRAERSLSPLILAELDLDKTLNRRNKPRERSLVDLLKKNNRTKNTSNKLNIQAQLKVKKDPSAYLSRKKKGNGLFDKERRFRSTAVASKYMTIKQSSPQLKRGDDSVNN